MWMELNVPGLRGFERILGFSLPDENQVAVIAYEGIYIVDLGAPDVVEFDDTFPEGGDLYDWQHQVLNYRGRRFHILGVYGGEPVMTSGCEEHLMLNSEQARLTVRDASGEVVLDFAFSDISGDWEYATFSPDSNYILLGMPYEIHVFRRARDNAESFTPSE